MEHKHRNVRIIFDGLIGAGKSTLLHAVKDYLEKETDFGERYDVCVVYENVAEWIGDGSLEFSYQNPKRGVFPLQIKSMLSKCPSEEDPSQCLQSKPTFYLTERSEYSAHFIFGEMHFEQGNMTSHEWKLCEKIYQTFTKKIDYCYFLQVNPELAMERLTKRGRDAEKGVPLTYMEQLDRKYREHFPNRVPFPCYFVNGDRTIDEIAREVGKHIYSLGGDFHTEDKIENEGKKC